MATVPMVITLEEFLKLPEEKPALEYHDGMVDQKVSPQGKHSAIQAALCELFNVFSRPRKIARAFPELRTTFAGASRVPDVAVYRQDRIPLDAASRIANDFFEPPDLVVEIVSPEQGVNPLVRRCLWYIGHGVTVALLVDPADESILLFRPDQIPRSLDASDLIEIDDIVPGLGLTAQKLFASLRID
ncbi:MAG TPA: Uma2 family endonuclease [Chloroflexota bacterium]|nr:Uma2 family endonuclease [Chloroflexota bacterium]